jgi:hypothetical protein
MIIRNPDSGILHELFQVLQADLLGQFIFPGDFLLLTIRLTERGQFSRV